MMIVSNGIDDGSLEATEDVAKAITGFLIEATGEIVTSIDRRAK